MHCPEDDSDVEFFHIFEEEFIFFVIDSLPYLFGSMAKWRQGYMVDPSCPHHRHDMGQIASFFLFVFVEDETNDSYSGIVFIFSLENLFGAESLDIVYPDARSRCRKTEA